MSNEISLSKFLSRFCNMTGKDLASLKHEDIKLLFPKIKRASFEEIEKNPSLLIEGDVLLVNDGTRVIPYFVPITNFDEMEEPMEVVIEHIDTRPQIDYKRHDYTKMSIYELRCLLRKKFNSIENQKRARIELERRGVVLSKKYKRCDEKRKVEEIKNERY